MTSPPNSPTSPNSGSWKRMLKDQYKILENEVLGEGASATVYKGLDMKNCTNVAVKLYKMEPGDSSGLEDFVKSVRVFDAINREKPKHGQAEGESTAEARQKHRHESFDANPAIPELAAYHAEMMAGRACSKTSHDSAGISRYQTDKFLEYLDVKSCFVQLLDYSKTDTGEPGLDPEDELLFLIFELGDESLEDKLCACSEEGKTLSSDELRSLQWTLVSIVWGLHAAGFVHLDIKPRNVMRFGDDGEVQWKLIDLDGAVPTGSQQRLRDLTFTPEYMPPELAGAFLNAPPSPGGSRSKGGTMTMSRLMDVWSTGMCALEAVFLQPVLRPFYQAWSDETGNDLKFFQWLSEYTSDPIVDGDMKEEISGIDKDMANLMEGMLTKDPSRRFCIGQCLAHKWFEPLRSRLVSEITLSLEAKKDNSGGVASAGISKACEVM